MIRKIHLSIFTALCIFFVTACGYKIAGYDKNKPIRFYVENVINDTIDPNYADFVGTSIKKYLIKYDELSSYDDATFFMEARLESIFFEADITSATDEAVTTDLTVEILIIITDVNGVEVYSRTYKTSDSFSVSQQIQTSLSNRQAAIEDCVETIMENFRSAFISKIL